MPTDCKAFVDDIHALLHTTDKLLFGLPFHKLWRTKNWKELLRAQDGVMKFTGGLVQGKMEEVMREEREKAEEEEDLQAELGMDFLTYMLHSGTMSAEEVAVNAMDMLAAGVDTVSTLCL